MIPYVIILMLCADPMTIYVDDSHNSKALISELTRDWTEVNGPPSAWLSVWDSDRRKALERVTIKKIDFALRDRKCPCYQFGYKGFTAFDDRAFSGCGIPLMTVETLIHNQDADTSSWKIECENSRWSSECRYRYEVYRFMIERHKINIYENGEEYSEPDVSQLRDKYGMYEGFPIYIEPKLPPCPVWGMPYGAREDRESPSIMDRYK